MSRRTFEGPMEWEYHNQGPVDVSSPFAQFSRKPPLTSFTSPSRMPNPFAGNAARGPNPFADNASPSRSQPLQQQQERQPPPPSASVFHPHMPNQPSGPSFRNPAFTTPQRRVDDFVLSEMSGADESPAGLTDASEVPADTPDFFDRTDDDYGRGTITPATAGRALLGRHSRTSGRGQVPRGNRDKVRKRKRQTGDRDVGSVRSRLPRDSDDSDSDWAQQHSGSSRARPGNRGGSFVGRLFTAIHDHPRVPIILSWWVQLGINLFIVSLCMWGVWSFISMMRADISRATEEARGQLSEEIKACSRKFAENRCAPKASRLPALDEVCDEWDRCMGRDPTNVMKVQISVRNVAEIINEFVSVMSLKAWGFIISTLLVSILANNVGFGRFREAAYTNQAKAEAAAAAAPSQPASHMPPMLPSSQNGQQAYIWAPIGHTPRHIRRGMFGGDATDTDGSPESAHAMLLEAPPQTPTMRRSPSKGGGDRGRSPTKRHDRSPSKGRY